MKMHIKSPRKKLHKLSNKLEMAYYSYQFTLDWFFLAIIVCSILLYSCFWFCLLWGYLETLFVFWIRVRAENFVGVDAYRLATFVCYALLYSFLYWFYPILGAFWAFFPRTKIYKDIFSAPASSEVLPSWLLNRPVNAKLSSSIESLMALNHSKLLKILRYESPKNYPISNNYGPRNNINSTTYFMFVH